MAYVKERTFTLVGRQALEKAIQQAGLSGAIPCRVSLKAENVHAAQYLPSHYSHYAPGTSE